MRRRTFLAAATGLTGCGQDRLAPERGFPSFLAGFEDRYAVDPLDAALAWFRAARRGLFLEYGVYSQLRRGPTVQFDERIPVARYAKLNDTFDPSGFDADRIADLAAAAGQRYVGLPARHTDGFCLFRTIETDFNSLESSGRDLVGELAEACRSRGLGLLLSYSYAADWRHPYFFPSETAQNGWHFARPPYESPQPEYKFRKDEDFLHYIRFAHNQLEELVYRYRPLAGLRLEPVLGYHARPDLFPIGQAYAVIREAQPGILISFGSGANGDEDFAAEVEGASADPGGGATAAAAWAASRNKPLEVSVQLTSFMGRDRGRPEADRRTVPDLLARRRPDDANLLLRVRLLPDGSLDVDDEKTLLELGAGCGVASARTEPR